MDDVKDKRKRNIAIEAALKSIKESLTGKHARGIMNNIESNIRYAYRRGYEDAKNDAIEQVDKHTFETEKVLCLDDDISVILENICEKPEPIIYTVSWISCGVPVVTAFDNYDAAKACYDAFKTKEGKCLDRVPVYRNFYVWSD